jgi:hypothetical protein
MGGELHWLFWKVLEKGGFSFRFLPVSITHGLINKTMTGWA